MANNDYIYFDDMAWPSLTRIAGKCEGDYLQWLCRYAPDRLMPHDFYLIADILSAYRQMIFDSIKKRNKVCSEIKKHLQKQR